MGSPGQTKRQVQGVQPKKPTIRVRPGSAEAGVGLFSQQEVAAILRLSVRTVRETERSPFEKLRRHPRLKALWREWLSGQIDEASLRIAPSSDLSLQEISALFALTRTLLERQALRKLIALTLASAE